MKKYDKKCRKFDKMVDVRRRKLYNYIDIWVMGKYQMEMLCI